MPYSQWVVSNVEKYPFGWQKYDSEVTNHQTCKNFLKELVDDMENNKLNDNEIKIIGEFYMNYNFK